MWSPRPPTENVPSSLSATASPATASPPASGCTPSRYGTTGATRPGRHLAGPASGPGPHVAQGRGPGPAGGSVSRARPTVAVMADNHNTSAERDQTEEAFFADATWPERIAVLDPSPPGEALPVLVVVGAYKGDATMSRLIAARGAVGDLATWQARSRGVVSWATLGAGGSEHVSSACSSPRPSTSPSPGSSTGPRPRERSRPSAPGAWWRSPPPSNSTTSQDAPSPTRSMSGAMPDSGCGPRQLGADRPDQISAGRGLMRQDRPVELGPYPAFDLIEQHGLAEATVAENGLTEPRRLGPGTQRSRTEAISGRARHHGRVHPEPRVVRTMRARTH